MSEPDETTGLLAASADDSIESNTSRVRNAKDNSETFSRAGKTTVLLAGLFIIMFQFADILRFSPSMRLFELGFCRQYYAKHDPQLIDTGGNVPEHLCKVGEIQEDLSLLKAWLGTLEGAVGLTLVIPYGILADIKGGRLVAALNLIGYALSSVWILCISFFWRTFSIDAVVISPLLRAIGGGAPVSSAVLLAIVANASPTSKRSTVFFLMGAAELVTEMIMPLVSAALMSKGFIYTPILLGFAFEALALLAVYLIPLDTGAQQIDKSPTVHLGDEGQERMISDSNDADKSKTTSLSRMFESSKILKNGRVLVLLGCFAIIKVGRQMLEMLVQYISKRFRWSFAQANVVFSVRAAGSLIMLLVILPTAKQILQTFMHLHTNRVDLLLAATSNFCLIAGSLGMGLGSTIPAFFSGLVVFTFGSGCRQSLQSLLSSLVERKDLTRLYTLVALFDGVGSILGAVLVNGGLKQGIHKGAGWLGLPFFIAAATYTVSFFGLLVAGR